MKAVILAGGLGTRLRPVTYEIPKPLIPVQGKTLTEHNFDLLKEAGITDIYLSIGHMRKQIKKYYGTGQAFGVNLSYIEEEEPLGTGGWLRLVPKFDDDFVVLNGDNLFDIDFKELARFHKAKQAVITIALKSVEDVESRGVAAMHGDRISSFVEKPKKEDAPSDLINSGYYVFSPLVFDVLQDLDAKKISLERDVFPRLADEGKLFGFKSDAQWFDTGTFERWEAVIRHWRKDDVSGD